MFVRVILLSLLFAIPASAAPILDQSVVLASGRAGIAVENGQSAAQIFTPSLSGSLAQVDLQIYRTTTSLTSPVTLEVRGVSGGLPDFGSPALGSVSFSAAALPVYNDPNDTNPTIPLYSLDVSQLGIDLSAGSQVALVLTNPTYYPDWVVWVNAGSYAAGSACYTPQPNAWSCASGQANGFQTFMAPEPAPAALIVLAVPLLELRRRICRRAEGGKMA